VLQAVEPEEILRDLLLDESLELVQARWKRRKVT
jgi:hypothetical protein